MRDKKTDEAEKEEQRSLMMEKAVLGAVLADARMWSVVQSEVRAEDFYRVAHQDIFEAMAATQTSGASVDALVVIEALRRAGKLEAVGGPAYVMSLADGMPKNANVSSYAKTVAETARLRMVQAIGVWLEERASSGAAEAHVLAAEASQRLSLTVQSALGGVVRARAAAEQYLTGLMDGASRETFGTGIETVDAVARIARRGDLTVVGARPGTGLTSFGLGMARHLAIVGTGCGYVTVGGTLRALAGRLLSWESGVNTEALESGRADETQYAKASEAFANLPDWPLFLIAGSRTVPEVTAWFRRLKEEHGVACAVVDSLQLLLPDRKTRRDEQQVSALVSQLRSAAERLDVAVVVLSQLWRAPESRTDKRPHLSELRETGADEAGTVVLVFREEMYRKKKGNEGVAEVIFAKNRNGPTGIVRCHFSKEQARFVAHAPDDGVTF